jgi:hypothetical protein
MLERLTFHCGLLVPMIKSGLSPPTTSRWSTFRGGSRYEEIRCVSKNATAKMVNLVLQRHWNMAFTSNFAREKGWQCHLSEAAVRWSSALLKTLPASHIYLYHSWWHDASNNWVIYVSAKVWAWAYQYTGTWHPTSTLQKMRHGQCHHLWTAAVSKNNAHSWHDLQIPHINQGIHPGTPIHFI